MFWAAAAPLLLLYDVYGFLSQSLMERCCGFFGAIEVDPADAVLFSLSEPLRFRLPPFSAVFFGGRSAGDALKLT